MISDKHKFIFIHINKTGGTSIETIFQTDAGVVDVPFKHKDAVFYKTAFPREFGEYFKFSFVRNSWDWIVSRYFWSKNAQKWFDYSFSEFLYRLRDGVPLSATAPWLERMMRPQVDRLSIDGRIAVDFVGKFETLQSDFDIVCRNLKIESTELPRIFKTDHDIYTKYYSNDLEGIVRSLYASDIETFGFRFGA